MENNTLLIQAENSVVNVYGVEEMLNIVESSPLHSLKKGEIQDYGELCDQDCIDCD